MEFTGVYHKTSEQMSYPLDEDRLIVNIKTGYSHYFFLSYHKTSAIMSFFSRRIYWPFLLCHKIKHALT